MLYYWAVLVCMLAHQTLSLRQSQSKRTLPWKTLRHTHGLIQKGHLLIHGHTRLLQGKSSTSSISTSDGLEIELLSSFSSSSSGPGSDSKTTRPPLIFLHGSFHAAWCWRENYFEFFNNLGFDCYAISLRGTSRTGVAPAQIGTLKAVAIQDHLSDVSLSISTVSAMHREKRPQSISTEPVLPILIAHSFAGIIIMKLLESLEERKKIGGVALLCSVPPSGNGPMTSRFIQRNIINAFKIVLGFVFKLAAKNRSICRELFFDSTVGDDDIDRYMCYFLEDSRIGIDVISLAPLLPSKTSMDPSTGQATWIEDSEHISATEDPKDSEDPDPNQLASRILVLGAEKDFIVDAEGVIETARYFGIKEPVVIEGAYHDMFLGPRWGESAGVLKDWLLTLSPS